MKSMIKSIIEKIKNLSEKTKKIIFISAISITAAIIAALLIFIIVKISDGKEPVTYETSDIPEQKIPTTETATGEEIDDIKEYIKKYYGNLYISPEKITKSDCEGYIIKPSKESPNEYFVGINKNGDIADTYNDYLNSVLSQQISSDLKNLLNKQNISISECVVKVSTLPAERYIADTENKNVFHYINNGKSKITLRLAGSSKTPGIFVQMSSKILNILKSKNIICKDISLYFNKSDLPGSEYKLLISSDKSYTAAQLSKLVEVNLSDEHISKEYQNEKAQENVNVPILMYHHLDKNPSPKMAATTPALFEEHLIALKKNGYTAISFKELVDYTEKGSKLPEKPIIITADDGYESNYQYMFPLLKKYKMKAAIFPVTSAMGKDTYRNTSHKILPHFNTKKAKEMCQSGLVEIGSHTHDLHQSKEYEGENFRFGASKLSGETDEEFLKVFKTDFEETKKVIKKDIGQNLFVYAYPYGKYNNITEDFLRKNDIKVTLTTNYNTNIVYKNKPECLYKMNRIDIGYDQNKGRFITSDDLINTLNKFKY